MEVSSTVSGLVRFEWNNAVLEITVKARHLL